MNTTNQPPLILPASHSELLILPDGRILVHNLTQATADLLHELNPGEDAIRPRAKLKSDSQATRPTAA